MNLDSLKLVRTPFIFDEGPMYHEFVADSVVKEPWNAYSSLFFFIPVIYWIWRLKGEYKQNLVLTVLMPLLFLNGLGSTLFHAFRVSDLLLILDWLPAALVVVIITGYLWSKALNSIVLGVVACVFFFFSAGFVFNTIQSKSLAMNLGYLTEGIGFLTPTIIILFKTKFKDWIHIFLALLCLGLALLFRVLDFPTPNPFPNFMPQGTHFLWHIISSFAVFFLGTYIYRLNKNTSLNS